MKYRIKKEFFPFSKIAPPIRSPKLAGFLGSMLRAPRGIFRDKEVCVKREFIKSYDGKEVEVIVFTPIGIKEPAPCLVYYHGGGFFFGAAPYHYKIAKEYAMKTPCKLVFVNYRLAPKHPFPTPHEDCYAALVWTFENAGRIGVDRTRIAVGGDSAGGALAAAVTIISRDRGTDMPVFQMLIYPVTDRRMTSESSRLFTDAPMWNTKLSRMMWHGYLAGYNGPDIAYASPNEADSFSGLAEAYVEIAEFDSLRDEGLLYADNLKKSGITVEINETEGTMHGYDIVGSAPTTKDSIARRIAYMKTKLYK